jgi:hypothetical protein
MVDETHRSAAARLSRRAGLNRRLKPVRWQGVFAVASSGTNLSEARFRSRLKTE